MFAIKGDVWVSEFGSRLVWLVDVLIGDPICSGAYSIDGAVLQVNEAMPGEFFMRHGLGGTSRNPKVTVEYEAA